MVGETVIAERVLQVRQTLKEEGLDAVWVRSTDNYLNEYVPEDSSERVWITGFTGSMGEALITLHEAYLAVDGRYWIQAEQEAEPHGYTILKASLSDRVDGLLIDKLRLLTKARTWTLGMPAAAMTRASFDSYAKQLQGHCRLQALNPSIVSRVRKDVGSTSPNSLRAVEAELAGGSTQEKLQRLFAELKDCEAVWIQKLDDIAYLSNLRGTELPFQSTFRAVAMATPDTLWVGFEATVPKVEPLDPAVRFTTQGRLFEMFKGKTVGFQAAETTLAAEELLQQSGAQVQQIPPVLSQQKALKSPGELRAMQSAFQKADWVMTQVIDWVQSELAAGNPISEADFARKVEALFLEQGATGLSFSVISAAGSNGAIIHYSQPQEDRWLRAGELMLLDTGGYFAEGYATDLTRTFLLGRDAVPTSEQRRYYTLVLKAAIAGLKARLPQGATGAQLDALVRAPIWEAGLD